MRIATDIIKSVANETDRVILFHSATGKDSIALLDLLAPHFKEIICVFMYIVKDLQHINRYIKYATDKYPNIQFVQIPHFGVYSYIKQGYLGCRTNPNQRLYTLAQLTDIVREKYNIGWAFFGFKQSDSMNRRLMLRTYENEAICRKTKKVYPLSKYRNKDIIHYINRNNLIQPECYGKGQSSGTALHDIDYLLFLRDKHKEDLDKVLAEYPGAGRLLFEYDYNNNSQ